MNTSQSIATGRQISEADTPLDTVGEVGLFVSRVSYDDVDEEGMQRLNETCPVSPSGPAVATRAMKNTKEMTKEKNIVNNRITPNLLKKVIVQNNNIMDATKVVNMAQNIVRPMLEAAPCDRSFLVNAGWVVYAWHM
mmetsp:Transcript_16334/g.19585  ORF Transcript_16334/g.19585 Transcript_16334/m.19585 type:complete len:137 (+) Transcript_16334:134-544(+)|eukprot:CAMPEP_0197845272 /NCGR_PEP_ID=MMETSP1438-20131217/2224_1 /TAXON_ID=1461541 /ORGANISM="Pterosperma sp., Strain CCMP1384" /LENGTH=136 /DNA_ID=CAMNT_0043456495 /DNA_START=144 /DNA_END=554 /DNA_ORIENTATION=-